MKKHIFITIISLLILQGWATAQTWEWAKESGVEVIHPVGLSHSSFKGTYLYRSYGSLDYSVDSAKTSIWFDAKSGELLARFQSTGENAVDSFTLGLAALHKAELGWWSKILGLLTFAAVIWLGLTGVWFWWFKKRRYR